MPRFRYECFCQLTYDPELSYEELLECEATLTPAVQDVLTYHNAMHLDFYPTGDSLYVQCLLNDQNNQTFADISSSLATVMGDHVQGRLVLIDKHGSDMVISSIDHGAFQLMQVRLPEPAAGVARKKPRCAFV